MRGTRFVTHVAGTRKLVRKFFVDIHKATHIFKKKHSIFIVYNFVIYKIPTIFIQETREKETEYLKTSEFCQRYSGRYTHVR